MVVYIIFNVKWIRNLFMLMLLQRRLDLKYLLIIRIVQHNKKLIIRMGVKLVRNKNWIVRMHLIRSRLIRVHLIEI